MNKLFFLFFWWTSLTVIAQTDSVNQGIMGKVIDQETGEPLPFVRIVIYDANNSQLARASTDFDGLYAVNNLITGTYTVECSFVGYEIQKTIEVKVDSLRKTEVNFSLETASQQLSCVEISYSPQLSKSYGVYSTVGGIVSVSDGESYAPINSNDFKQTKTAPLSTFSIDVDKAAYSNIRRFITDGSLPPKDAVRIEEMINYFKYDYPEPQNEDPFSITTSYAACPWNANHQLVQIGLKGKSLQLDDAPASNLVFLLDVSGSMQAPNKLGLLKAGFELLVDQLTAKDRVSIVVYAGAAGLVLKPTKGSEKETIKQAISGLEAGGSTAGGSGIELAYKVAKENFIKGGNNRVILATDGDFNVGISAENDLENLIVSKREDDIFLSVLGFGTGNLKDSKMERLADKGNGNYAYIDSYFEAKKVLVTEMGGTLFTIAKDVKIQVEFNPEHVKGYRLIGYENRLLADEDFNNDKIDAGELGAGHNVTALYEIIPANSLEKITDIDNLKYQSTTKSPEHQAEVLTVKLRYKDPTGIKSKLLTRVVLAADFGLADQNLSLSAAVAEFGLLLLDSKFKGDASYKKLIERIKTITANDENGYRAEFLRLVQAAADLKR